MIYQRSSEKGTNAKSFLIQHHTELWPATLPLPAFQVPQVASAPHWCLWGASALGRVKQFSFSFCNKSAGEGYVIPQSGFQTKGKQDDAVTKGCRVTVTPSAPWSKLGLSTFRWEQALAGWRCWVQAGQQGAAYSIEQDQGPSAGKHSAGREWSTSRFTQL